MIRANLSPQTRTHSRLKGDQHRSLLIRISQLQNQNKQLRTQLLMMERRLLQFASAKRKYKEKYRQAKQKIQILAMVNRERSPHSQHPCLSPKNKTTRMHTFSSEEFNSIKMNHNSEDEHVETKVEIDHFHPQLKPVATPAQKQRVINDGKIFENLMKLHEQLDKLSMEIQKKPQLEKQVGLLQSQLYRKMEEIVDKMTRLEDRDIQRENRRKAHQREVAARRYTASAKSVQSIGKDLAEFKVFP